MSETEFKKKVMKHIKKHYGHRWLYKSCDRFTVGIPDLICCIGGFFVAIELKVDDNKPTPAQISNMRKIREAGGVAGAAWNMRDVKKLLKEAENKIEQLKKGGLR